ncbi:MAG: Kinesin [Vezdaea aestivalis]|nr:MAG: Kinesin [Vezdaea aestivalis]
MDVQLYVYDLSKGLARQLSMQLLGTQIDAVYHTALVFGGVEYLFGAGIQTCTPASSHLGNPVEIIDLGQTCLPEYVIAEYLDSLRKTYTPESYDLFMHNCNNFTNDFALFLVGKGIPEHITSLPQTVLNTPFGQMLRPSLEQSMKSVTQAPVPPQNTALHATNGALPNGTSAGHGQDATKQLDEHGKVHDVTSSKVLQSLLGAAKASCAAIFFTSATCPPCKIVYPAYDQLAAEAGSKATLIKVDISRAYDIASQYSVRATPTFMTFLHGEKENQWNGADEGKLLGNIRMLIQMAYPPHPHSSLRLNLIRGHPSSPVSFSKHGPLEKLVTKLDTSDPIVAEMRSFIESRESSDFAIGLPDLPEFASYLQSSIDTLELNVLFAAMDLWRLSLVDPRVSGFFSILPGQVTIDKLLRHLFNFGATCSYPLRLTSLHVLANLFTSPVFCGKIVRQMPETLASITTFVAESLLDDQHPQARVVASALAFNLTLSHQKAITENDQPSDGIPDTEAVELTASLFEAIQREKESDEALRLELFALSLLALNAPVDGEISQMFKVMDMANALRSKFKEVKEKFPNQVGLVKELADELLAG